MILTNENVIVTIFNNYEKINGSFLINGVYYPFGEIHEISVPDNVVAHKYCYTVEKGFFENPLYQKIPTPIQELEQQIKSLQETNAALLLELVLKGVI